MKLLLVFLQNTLSSTLISIFGYVLKMISSNFKDKIYPGGQKSELIYLIFSYYVLGTVCQIFDFEALNIVVYPDDIKTCSDLACKIKIFTGLHRSKNQQDIKNDFVYAQYLCFNFFFLHITLNYVAQKDSKTINLVTVY